MTISEEHECEERVVTAHSAWSSVKIRAAQKVSAGAADELAAAVFES
jgi:hypothetical protein